MGADEVEHGAERLALGLSQTSAELLEEQCWALGWSQHQDGVDRRHVDALVEEIDGEHDLTSPAARSRSAASPFGPRAVTPDGDRGDPVEVEVPSHEPGVLDAYAEAQAAHRRRRLRGRPPV